jgi:hypothetical protein
MAGNICVTKMAWRMKDEMDRKTKGTKYEGKGHFYHDMMTVMTCKNKMYTWQQKGDIYNNSIPGDIPELIRLYENFNMDTFTTVRHHVTLTSHMLHDDQTKYCLPS